MTILVRLGHGDLIHDLDADRELTFVHRLEGGRVQLRALQDNEIVTFADTELCKRLFAGRLRITFNRPRWLKPIEHILVKDFELLPEKDRAIARRRHPYAVAVQTRCKHTGSLAEIRKVVEPLAQERGETPPPPITVWRFTKRWIASGEDLLALVRGHGGGRKGFERFPEVMEIIGAHIIERYLVREHPPVTLLYDGIKREIKEINRHRPSQLQLPIPAIGVIYREIDAIDPYEKMAAHKGRAAANAHFKPNGKGLTASRPLETVMLDNTRLDVGVTWGGHWLGRPWLWVSIDLFSRMIVGLRNRH